MRVLLLLWAVGGLWACQTDTSDQRDGSTDPAVVTGVDEKGPAHRFDAEIEAFERRDREAGMPERGGVVMVGSSSIRLWNSAESDLAPLPVIRRGFGGARIDDVLHFMDRIVLPYQPSMVVFFAGTNDLAGNEDDLTPAEIRDRYEQFVTRLHEELPETDVYFISITPSKAREAQLPEVKATNDLIEAYSAGQPKAHFFDLEGIFLNDDGSVDETYFVNDGLHLNKRGYAAWKAMMQAPLMRAYMKKPKVQ